jgi:predicted dithiol-disulfide oxidoreductase (DUF899 family)
LCREEVTVSLPQVVSRDEWLVARRELLTREKEATRARDALNADRRRLPMVKIDKQYDFEGRTGRASLLDLFDGDRQLVIQHFMFDPSWTEGCSSCSAAVDETSAGLLAHLRARDTNFAIVSRAPIAKIEAYRTAKGWEVPWYSSFGSDFNYDFHVTLDESVTPIEFNYRNRDELATAGMDWMLQPDAQPSEQPGYSAFLRDGADIFHTYSTFGRGTEALGGAYAFLDMTALGRQEDWEEPTGRASDAHGAVPNFAT